MISLLFSSETSSLVAQDRSDDTSATSAQSQPPCVSTEDNQPINDVFIQPSTNIAASGLGQQVNNTVMCDIAQSVKNRAR